MELAFALLPLMNGSLVLVCVGAYRAGLFHAQVTLPQ